MIFNKFEHIINWIQVENYQPIFYVNNQSKFVVLIDCRQALARADVLLSMKHGMTRLDNVWGVGGGLRPVHSLVRSMGLLLQVRDAT